MKLYSHDYSLPRKAESLLGEVCRIYDKDLTKDALQLVVEARGDLIKYLAEHNMIESADEDNGLIRARDTFNDDQLDLIRDLFLDYLVAHPKLSFADELLQVINVCQRQTHLDEFESVEQLLNNTSGSWAEISPSAQ